MKLRSWKRWRRAPGRVVEVARAIRVLKNWLKVCLQYAGITGYQDGAELILRSGIRLRTRQAAEMVTGWGVWVREEYRVSKGLGTVVDVGANIGAFTLLAVDRGASRIVAVEPASRTCELLRENLFTNGVAGRVEVVQAGIGGESGARALFLAPDSPMSTCCHSGGAGSEAETVRIMTIEQLMAEHQLSHVDLLKMDCEGAEYEALRVSTSEMLQRVDRIILEYHANGDYRELVEKLREAGFELKRHTRNGNGTGILDFARAKECCH